MLVSDCKSDSSSGIGTVGMFAIISSSGRVDKWLWLIEMLLKYLLLVTSHCKAAHTFDLRTQKSWWLFTVASFLTTNISKSDVKRGKLLTNDAVSCGKLITWPL